MNRHRNDRGFTLVELLVACAVLALALAAVTTVHRSTLQAYVMGSNKTEVQQNVRIALERMSRELRQSAAPLTAATHTSFTLTDQDTRLPVTYDLTGEGSSRTLTRTTNGVSDTVIPRVQVPPSRFVHRDINNNALASPVGTPANVFRVDITIQTASEDAIVAGGIADTKAEMTTSVRLRNL